MRPSYFVALRIEDKFCIEAIKNCQQKILNQNPNLEKLAIVKEKFHFTLCLLIKDQNVVFENWLTATKDAFRKACMELQHSFKNVSKEICLKNVSHFKNRVLYIDTDYNGSQFLNELNKNFSLVFLNANLTVFHKNPFKPHMTIAKSTQKHKGHISETLFEEFKDFDFGSQIVSKLYLCSMLDSPREDGFYHTICEFDFLTNSFLA